MEGWSMRNAELSMPNEELYLATNGVFDLGGPGAYLFEGRSGSGKNFLLKQMLLKTKTPFKNVISLSTTQADTGSLDFIEQIYDGNRWGIARNIGDLMYVEKTRARSLEKIKASLGLEERDQFVRQNPMLMIVDDIGGTTNTKNSENNPWYTLFTTCRHRGIYLVLLVQHAKQLGPAFLGNTRAIVTFDSAEQSLKHFESISGMTLTKADRHSLQVFLKTRYNFLIWWKSWAASSALPCFPWLCGKVTPNDPVVTINGSEYNTWTAMYLDKKENINCPENTEDESEFDEMTSD